MNKIWTYVHSYSFHKSTHSNGSGQITLAQGLFDGQLRSKLRAIVACPHWVPFNAGGSGKCLPSNLIVRWREREWNLMKWSHDKDLRNGFLGLKKCESKGWTLGLNKKLFLNLGIKILIRWLNLNVLFKILIRLSENYNFNPKIRILIRWLKFNRWIKF